MATSTIEGQRGGIHHRVDGPPRGPVLVLSSSLGAGIEMWGPQMPALAARFQVLRYDARGHGLSAVTPGPYTIARLGRDVLMLLDALSIERAHFCGLSLGGLTGLWLAATAPERVGKLVLACTAPKIGTREMWAQRIDSVREGGMASIADAVVARWFTEGFRGRAPEAVARARASLLATPIEGYVGCCAAVRDADLRDAASSIGLPTLVLAGAHDEATPAAEGRALAERIQGARYVELDAAHLANIEDARGFTAALLGFLGEEER